MRNCPSISLSVCRINTCCGGMSRVYERLRRPCIPTCRRYVVNKAGAANAAPALKYKFYFTPHFGGYTEFGIVPIFPAFLFSVCTSKTNTVHPYPRSLVSVWALNSPCSWLFYPIHRIGFVHVQNLSNTSSADPAIVHL